MLHHEHELPAPDRARVDVTSRRHQHYQFETLHGQAGSRRGTQGAASEPVHLPPTLIAAGQLMSAWFPQSIHVTMVMPRVRAPWTVSITVRVWTVAVDTSEKAPHTPAGASWP